MITKLKCLLDFEKNILLYFVEILIIINYVKTKNYMPEPRQYF